MMHEEILEGVNRERSTCRFISTARMRVFHLQRVAIYQSIYFCHRRLVCFSSCCPSLRLYFAFFIDLLWELSLVPQDLQLG